MAVQSIAAFGAAYMTVIIVEPLADLTVLAAAKGACTGSRTANCWNGDCLTQPDPGLTTLAGDRDCGAGPLWV